ncbi:MAG TPA: glycosyltransferase family 4 protein [Roseiarcus sp.]|nr:glycosyltransferase family 4 protein [Roseiarcus sp.]
MNALGSSGFRLILLSPHNPENVRAWSGTVHFAFRALRKLDPSIEAVSAGPLDRIVALSQKVSRKLGLIGDFRHTRAFATLASLIASLSLRFKNADAIVAIAASTHVYALRTRLPVVYVSDATFAAIVASYQEFAQFPKWLREEGDAVERSALARSSAIVYPSDWAKDSAVKDYGVSPEKIAVMPLGPNFDREAIDRFRTRKSADFGSGVRLLFVGMEWVRKGGPIALEVMQILVSRGIRCELVVVGKAPEEAQKHEGVRFIGPLNKNDHGQLAALCEIYERAHFLVLPTRQEAFGVVFSEAQAFGCPSLSYAVGGAATAVKDGVTGFALPLEASASDFADRIFSLVHDPRRYEEMSANCRARYEQEANWDVWAAKVMELARAARNAPV